MENNNKKNILLFIMIISIICVLLAGIVYQFVVIKSLQKQISDLTSNFYVFLNNV